MIRVDRTRLGRLLKDFHALTGFRIGFFDVAGHELFAEPASLSPFCEALRKFPEAEARCVRCDREAFQRASEGSEFITYPCHAGLVEALAPLFQDGERIGYLMIGQLVPRGSNQDPWKTTERAILAAGAHPEELQRLFDLLGTMDPVRIRAALGILEVGALHLIHSAIVQKKRPSLEESLRTAVARSPGRRTSSVSALSREVGIGRTSLYDLSHRAFGEPVGVHVRAIRLEEAKRLLEKSGLPIAAVSRALGIRNESYFSRWFKRETGKTPTVYRRERRGP